MDAFEVRKNDVIKTMTKVIKRQNSADSSLSGQL